MTMDELRAMKDELDALGINLSETLQRCANKLIMHRETASAGALLVFERISSQHIGNALHWLSARLAVEPEPAKQPAKRAPAGKRAPKGQGEHRHKFNEAGVCDLMSHGVQCGAKRQRAPKGAAAAKPDAAARTLSLPAPPFHSAVPRPIGDDVPDRFDGGAFGSSSTSERR